MKTIEMAVTSIQGRTDARGFGERTSQWIDVTVSAESTDGESVTFTASPSEFAVGDPISVHVGSGLAEKLRR